MYNDVVVVYLSSGPAKEESEESESEVSQKKKKGKGKGKKTKKVEGTLEQMYKKLIYVTLS